MSIYDGMLPKEFNQGKIGYYPVMNKEEWDALPDLYKAMEWSAIPDPLDKNKKLRAVKSVTFDVVYMEPYGISAKVSVHPQEIQKLLFCYHENTQCQLYSICGVELEGGTRLSAKWLQDSTTGAFAVLAGNHYVAMQGGFRGHVPECIGRKEDGTFKWKGFGNYEKTNHFSFSDVYRNGRSQEQEKVTEKDVVKRLMDAVAEYGLEAGWTDHDIIDTLVDCGITRADFKKYGKEDFVKEYFEAEASKEEETRGYVCKCCGEVIHRDISNPSWFDEYGEEELWGHLQMNHEKIFNECQDWETPWMLEEYFDRVDGKFIDPQEMKVSLKKRVEDAKGRVKEAAENEKGAEMSLHRR